MAIGVSVLFSAFLETLVRVVMGGPVIEEAAATEQHIE
jgi:hypothetical protein